MKITRRHFLLATASALGACFLPAAFFRRLARFPAEPAAAIDPPASARRTLFATPLEDDSERWQLALGRPTTELPDAPSWRVWFAEHEGIDPDDPAAVQRWLTTHGRPPAPPGSRWLSAPVAGAIWDDYLENRFLLHDSPEAQALQYLSRLRLAHGPVVDATGARIGRLDFFAGTMPGAESHFVEAEGEAILPALQHRLRELGESTAIEILP